MFDPAFVREVLWESAIAAGHYVSPLVYQQRRDAGRPCVD
jgi:hypothetical protein